MQKSKEKAGDIEDELREQTVTTQNQLEDLENTVLEQAKKIKAVDRQLSSLPANIGIAGTSGGNRSKMPDPPTFSGSNDKGDVNDWIRQIKLYTKHMGIVTDTQQIVYTLSRIRSPASKYLTSYYDKNAKDQDLGSWENFIKVLYGIYGQKDSKASAKEEFTSLWANKSLAARDFIKYSEQFKTLTSIVEYKDDVLIDKLHEVIPSSLATAVGIIESVSMLRRPHVPAAAYLECIVEGDLTDGKHRNVCHHLSRCFPHPR